MMPPGAEAAVPCVVSVLFDDAALVTIISFLRAHRAVVGDVRSPIAAGVAAVATARRARTEHSTMNPKTDAPTPLLRA